MGANRAPTASILGLNFAPVYQTTSWPRSTRAPAITSAGLTCPVIGMVQMRKRAIIIPFALQHFRGTGPVYAAWQAWRDGGVPVTFLLQPWHAAIARILVNRSDHCVLPRASAAKS